MVLDAFKRGIFWLPPTEETGRPSEVLLTSEEMLERLPIAFAQLKAGNAFEKLPNEILQIMYSSYWVKNLT